MSLGPHHWTPGSLSRKGFLSPVPHSIVPYQDVPRLPIPRAKSRDTVDPSMHQSGHGFESLGHLIGRKTCDFVSRGRTTSVSKSLECKKETRYYYVSKVNSSCYPTTLRLLLFISNLLMLFLNEACKYSVNVLYSWISLCNVVQGCVVSYLSAMVRKKSISELKVEIETKKFTKFPSFSCWLLEFGGDKRVLLLLLFLISFQGTVDGKSAGDIIYQDIQNQQPFSVVGACIPNVCRVEVFEADPNTWGCEGANPTFRNNAPAANRY